MYTGSPNYKQLRNCMSKQISWFTPHTNIRCKFIWKRKGTNWKSNIITVLVDVKKFFFINANFPFNFP